MTSPRTIQSCALTTLCLSVFLLLTSSAGSATKVTSVRMAYLQNDIHHLALWVGMEKEFYKDEGITVDIVGTFRSGPELMNAFTAGELDVAFVGEAPATIAVARGSAHVHALAQANTEGSALVVSKAVKAGKRDNLTLAMPGHGTVQDLLLTKALPHLGLDGGKVNVIVLRPPEMVTALESGEIDGFIAWEPYPSQAVTGGFGEVLIASRDIWANHPCCIMAASDAFLQTHPDAAAAMIRAHHRATAYLHDHQDESVAIAIKYTGMKESVIRGALQHVDYVDSPSVDGEKEYVSFLNGMKVIQVEDSAAFTSSFINTGLREKALQ